MSLDLLGAEPRGILIKVRNAQQLAAAQGGTAGAVAASLVPETIEGVVLDKMVAEFRKTLAAKGVDASVDIVSATPHKPATSGFGMGMALGAGLAGAGFAFWKFGLSRYL